jgi:hypothetical protein
VDLAGTNGAAHILTVIKDKLLKALFTDIALIFIQRHGTILSISH